MKNSQTSRPVYLRVSESARRVGVSDTALYKAIQVGTLKSIEFMGHIGIEESELQRWFASRRRGPRRRSEKSESAAAA